MPVMKRSYYGFVCTVLAIVLLILKIARIFPMMTFTIFGIGLLGLADTLYVRFRLKEKSPLDWITFAVGGMMLIWTLSELLFPH